MNEQPSEIALRLLRYLMSAFIWIGVAGCSLVEGDSDASEANDVCEDVFNRFVSQNRDGLGITRAQCSAADRGEWIDGRCYCHGTQE